MAATETRTYAQYFVPAFGPVDAPVSIGWPVSGKDVVLLDEQGRPVREGDEGEIAVRSAYIADGYVNDATATREKFLPQEDGTVLYRAGDRGRFGQDGSLLFLGRNDSLVKIRGYRVELQGIESVLHQHPSVQQVAVIAREDTPGDPEIVAYVVPRQHGPVAVHQLHGFLASQLPGYMIPSAFVTLEALPLTANRKLDRRRLPAPPSRLARNKGASSVEGHDPVVSGLLAIWETVLFRKPPAASCSLRESGKDRSSVAAHGACTIGVRDNFFDLGGQSLLAAELLLRIEQAFGKKLSLSSLFLAPTVEQLAGLLGDGDFVSQPSRLLPIQPSGSRPPLFWIGAGPFIRPLSKRLGSDQPLLGLTFKPSDPVESTTPYSIPDIAREFIEAIQAAYPEGPCFLGAHCLSGTVAYEVARQPMQGGRHVALLVLLEADGKAFDPGPELRQAGRLDATAERYNFSGALKMEAFGVLRRVARRAERLFDTARRATEQMGSGDHPGPKGSPTGGIDDILRMLRLAAAQYDAQPYRGRVALFHCGDRRTRTAPHLPYGWRGVLSCEPQVYEVPGDHMTMLSEPHVEVLAARLRYCLSEACESTIAQGRYAQVHG